MWSRFYALGGMLPVQYRWLSVLGVLPGMYGRYGGGLIVASVCDSFCDGCVYKCLVSIHQRCCNYLDLTGKRRPCPPGKGCTVKIEGKYKRTVEERQSECAIRQRQYRDRQRAARMRTVKCVVCGTEFQTSDARKKFCSQECYDTNRIRVWREKEKMRRAKNGS